MVFTKRIVDKILGIRLYKLKTSNSVNHLLLTPNNEWIVFYKGKWRIIADDYTKKQDI